MKKGLGVTAEQVLKYRETQAILREQTGATTTVADPAAREGESGHLSGAADGIEWRNLTAAELAAGPPAPCTSEAPPDRFPAPLYQTTSDFNPRPGEAPVTDPDRIVAFMGKTLASPKDVERALTDMIVAVRLDERRRSEADQSARVKELEEAIGVMAPTICRGFLQLATGDVDRTSAHAVLKRLNDAMGQPTEPLDAFPAPCPAEAPPRASLDAVNGEIAHVAQAAEPMIRKYVPQGRRFVDELYRLLEQRQDVLRRERASACQHLKRTKAPGLPAECDSCGLEFPEAEGPCSACGAITEAERAYCDHEPAGPNASAVRIFKVGDPVLTPMGRRGVIQRIIEGTEWPKPYAWVAIDGDADHEKLDIQCAQLRHAPPADPTPSDPRDAVVSAAERLFMQLMGPGLREKDWDALESALSAMSSSRPRATSSVANCVDCDCVYIETGRRNDCTKHRAADSSCSARELEALREVAVAATLWRKACNVESGEALAASCLCAALDALKGGS